MEGGEGSWKEGSNYIRYLIRSSCSTKKPQANPSDDEWKRSDKSGDADWAADTAEKPIVGPSDSESMETKAERSYWKKTHLIKPG